ncbi:MAG: NAD(P)-dependent oxidoreductase [Euzebyales bacterium]|nr:NAD(P)-dependent oxidoreductase [Euzebyales bacterium]
MMIVDRALQRREEEGNPVGVALVGAGFQASGIARQIVAHTPGMKLVAIANRTPDRAVKVLEEAGAGDVDPAATAADVDRAAARGRPAVTDDPEVVCAAESVDAIVEVTGTVEFAAHAALSAIEHGKHVVLMNPEVDGTVGPILAVRADQAGVMCTASDGDQPGVQSNLYRFVRGMGLRPLVCGNIKGLHDPYRNPTTQAGFAAKWGQDPYMVTSFADGTKISFEQAIVANATGMTVARRGMLGHTFDGHVDDATSLFELDELEAAGGIVDYLVAARPAPGVFVYATADEPGQRHYLNLYKLGEGPLYSFYTPYHLCHFEVPASVARAVLLEDPVMKPLGAPRVEVVAAAKTDLAAGDVLDRLGGYLSYGLAERADVTADESLLPIGVAEGCRLLRAVAKDAALTYDDVELPADRLVDRLREEQRRHFGG